MRREEGLQYPTGLRLRRVGRNHSENERHRVRPIGRTSQVIAGCFPGPSLLAESVHLGVTHLKQCRDPWWPIDGLDQFSIAATFFFPP